MRVSHIEFNDNTHTHTIHADGGGWKVGGGDTEKAMMRNRSGHVLDSFFAGPCARVVYFLSTLMPSLSVSTLYSHLFIFFVCTLLVYVKHTPTELSAVPQHPNILQHTLYSIVLYMESE